MSSSLQLLNRYRELLRLIQRLPGSVERTAAWSEARSVFRSRSQEQDALRVLDHQRELASKIAYLKVITPKRPGGATGTGTYVLRDGKLVEGSGETRGSRVADGVISPDEAVKRNNRDFKRFYGGQKPGNVFF